MNDQQLLRYSRHILLDEVGVEGQERLLNARALIVGAGGLGSPAAIYLAAAGTGRITLADNDTVDFTNLQRQILHNAASVGRMKAASGRDHLAVVNPEVEVVAIEARAEGALLAKLVADSDVVLDCSDNFATRHAINRACIAARRPLVSGAAMRFDGQVAVFDLRRGRQSLLSLPVSGSGCRRGTALRGDGRVRAVDRHGRRDPGRRSDEAHHGGGRRSHRPPAPDRRTWRRVAHGAVQTRPRIAPSARPARPPEYALIPHRPARRNANDLPGDQSPGSGNAGLRFSLSEAKPSFTSLPVKPSISNAVDVS
ncbi:MAG: HesA/MoeB/ThiF family protein [Rhodospirillales bacterium]